MRNPQIVDPSSPGPCRIPNITDENMIAAGFDQRLASLWRRIPLKINSSIIGSTIWGILMCLIYFRTRTLAVPIIIHMLWNWTNFVVEGMTQLFMPGLMTTVELRYET